VKSKYDSQELSGHQTLVQHLLRRLQPKAFTESVLFDRSSPRSTGLKTSLKLPVDAYCAQRSRVTGIQLVVCGAVVMCDAALVVCELRNSASCDSQLRAEDRSCRTPYAQLAHVLLCECGGGLNTAVFGG
jgi:hypothetical protein